MFIQRRDKEDNRYFRLQQQSLDMIQKLSGKRWTDFNEHDPGVTIMDILNYNLLEVIYQTDFNFEKYLTHPSLSYLKLSEVGLLAVNDIFAPCIVTPNDYENLIETQIKDVSRCKVKMIGGNRYQIYIDIEHNTEPETIIDQVKKLYHANRNIGENLVEVIQKKMAKAKKKKKLTYIKYNKEVEKIEAQNTLNQLHTSVQYDFPNTYGVNQYGLPAHASEQQKAQALQLKGYLLIFDYLLSATKQQLGGLHQTMSLSERILSPFSYQIRANDLDQLLDVETLEQTNIFEEEELDKQKSAYLDMLDALYSEDTSFIGADLSLPLNEVNRRRAKLIQQLPTLNTNRFRSFNLLESNDIPAIKQLIGYMIDVNTHCEVPIANIFARYRLQLIDDATFFTTYRQKFNIDVVEGIDSDPLYSVPLIDITYSDSKYEELYVRINLLWYNVLYQSFLSYGSDMNNYRIIAGWGKGCLLIFKIPNEKGWITLGQSYEKETLIKTANLLSQFIQYLNTKNRHFYMLEHILLNVDQDQTPEYNKLSIVYSQSITFFEREEYQERIKERLPIHIEVEFVGLPIRKMIQFERNYYAWRKALPTDKKEQIQEHAEAIKLLMTENKE